MKRLVLALIACCGISFMTGALADNHCSEGCDHTCGQCDDSNSDNSNCEDCDSKQDEAS